MWWVVALRVGHGFKSTHYTRVRHAAAQLSAQHERASIGSRLVTHIQGSNFLVGCISAVHMVPIFLLINNGVSYDLLKSIQFCSAETNHLRALQAFKFILLRYPPPRLLQLGFLKRCAVTATTVTAISTFLSYTPVYAQDSDDYSSSCEFNSWSQRSCMTAGVNVASTQTFRVIPNAAGPGLGHDHPVEVVNFYSASGETNNRIYHDVWNIKRDKVIKLYPTPGGFGSAICTYKGPAWAYYRGTCTISP